MRFHRHSLFPLVLALLTAGLFLVILFSFSGSPKQETQETIVLTAQEYQDHMRSWQESFFLKWEGKTPIMISKEQAIKEGLEDLFQIRVPDAYRQTHLNLVLLFSRFHEKVTLSSEEQTLFMEELNPFLVQIFTP